MCYFHIATKVYPAISTYVKYTCQLFYIHCTKRLIISIVFLSFFILVSLLEYFSLNAFECKGTKLQRFLSDYEYLSSSKLGITKNQPIINSH